MVLPSGHVPDIVGTKLKISGTLSANNIVLEHYCGHVPDVPSRTVCVPVKLAGQCPCTTLPWNINKKWRGGNFTYKNSFNPIPKWALTLKLMKTTCHMICCALRTPVFGDLPLIVAFLG